jgi:hypothetical protein
VVTVYVAREEKKEIDLEIYIFHSHSKPDQAQGSIICTDCGRVLSNFISDEPEWRNFEGDDNLLSVEGRWSV